MNTKRQRLFVSTWKRVLVGMMVVVGALWGIACTPGAEPQQEITLPDVPEADRQEAVKGHCDFAISLYKQLKGKEGNLFFSPYSISSALTMTYAGARGNTAQEMRDTLALRLDDDKLHPANAWLSIDLNNRGVKGPFKLAVVNRLWGQQDFPFASAFLGLLSDHYRAGLEKLDFASDPNGARETINRWVAQQTADRIKDLLPEGSIKDITKLVLTNAIYFKAPWAEKFKESQTKPAPFHLSDGTKVQVDTMTGSDIKGLHADLEKHVLVSLPYKEANISMVILMPKEGNELSALETSLTREELDKWLDQAKSATFAPLSMPKFKIEQDLDLVEPLKGMGMKEAFTANADLSGMIEGGGKGLAVSKVIHKAFIEVDEEGTEAAAATAVVVNLTSAPTGVSLKLDRPFLFMIRDNKTGNLLFMGRLANPSK